MRTNDVRADTRSPVVTAERYLLLLHTPTARLAALTGEGDCAGDSAR